MGRHSAAAPDAHGDSPDARDDGADRSGPPPAVDGGPLRSLGPVTDPLLLDAVQEQLRREREREGLESEPPHSLADLQRAWGPYRRPPAPRDRAEPDAPDLEGARSTSDAPESPVPGAGGGPRAPFEASPPDTDRRAVDEPPAAVPAAPRPALTARPLEAADLPVGGDPAPDRIGLSLPMFVVVLATGIAAALALSVLAVVPH